MVQTTSFQGPWAPELELPGLTSSSLSGVPAGRDPYRVGHLGDQRSHPEPFLLGKARGSVEGVAAQAVRADQLGEIGALVHRCLPLGSQLEEVDAVP